MLHTYSARTHFTPLNLKVQRVVVSVAPMSNTEQLEEIEGRLLDLKSALRRMDYNAPQWLKDAMNAIKELQYSQYKMLRELGSREPSDTKA